MLSLYFSDKKMQEGMNEDEFLQLIDEKKHKKASLSRCIICQKEKRNESLTSTENRRSSILSPSKLLKDDLLADLDAEEVNSIQYHLTLFKLALRQVFPIYSLEAVEPIFTRFCDFNHNYVSYLPILRF